MLPTTSYQGDLTAYAELSSNCVAAWCTRDGRKSYLPIRYDVKGLDLRVDKGKIAK